MKKIIAGIFILSVMIAPRFTFAQLDIYSGNPVGVPTPQAPQVDTYVMDPNQTAGQPITTPEFEPPAAHVCGASIDDITDVICKIATILNAIIPVLMTLGIVYFIWGVLTYFIANEEEAKKKGRDRIIFGIIGLVVITSVWGLVFIIRNTFDLTGTLDISQVTANIPVNDAGTCTMGSNPKLANLLTLATCYISSFFVPLLFSLAILVFMWGVIQYIQGAEEQEKREKGRIFMIWGIIALSVMISIWGLVHIFTNTFNIDYAIPHVKNTY